MSKGTIDTLMEVGWVKIRGRKRTPGRPVTYGTTEAFLVQFGLESVGHLPGAGRTQGRGLPGSHAAVGLRRPQSRPTAWVRMRTPMKNGDEPEELATGSVNLDEA